MLICLIVQIAAFTALGLSGLEPHRAALAATLGLHHDSVWILVAAVALAALVITFSSLYALLAAPLRDVTAQCADGRFAGHAKDSRTREDKLLREYLKQIQELGDRRALQLERLEDDLFAAQKERDRSDKKLAEMEDLVTEYGRIRQELSIDNATLRNEKDTLAHALEQERSNKVGLEVKKRSDEIYSQVENALSSAAMKAVWMPGLLSEIRMPGVIIRDLSRRFSELWEHTSIAQLRQIADEIREQNQQQLQRLDSLIEHCPAETPFALNARNGTPVASDLRQILSEDHSKTLTLDIEEDESLLVESIRNERVLAFLRSFAHFARNQLDSGRLSLRVAREQDRDAPAIDISVSSEEDLRQLMSSDAVSELARSYGVVSTDKGSTDKELHLSFALERFANR